MENHENGNLFFEMEDMLEKVYEVSRKILVNSLDLNGKSIDFVEQPSPALTLYTERNEKMAVELAYHVEMLMKLHNKIA